MGNSGKTVRDRESFQHGIWRFGRLLRTMDQEGRRAGRLGGIVACYASIVAVMRSRRALYPQCEIKFADLVRGSLPRFQWPAILQPGDLQRWIALADRAGHVHPRARLDIVGKAKRIDFRRYCKLQEAREFISHHDDVRSSSSSSSSLPATRWAGRSREKKESLGELTIVYVLFQYLIAEDNTIFGYNRILNYFQELILSYFEAACFFGLWHK